MLLIESVKEVFGEEFDNDHIYKILERKDFVLEDTIDFLVNFKEKQNDKNKKKVEVKKVEPAKKIPFQNVKNETKNPEKGVNMYKSDVSVGKQGINFIEIQRKSSRRISKDDFKELSIDKKAWNASYPIINYVWFSN